MRIGIAGGGIFGVSSAFELARRGHDVELFERGDLPAEDASGTDISKAIRMEYGEASSLYAPLVRRALDRWREIERGGHAGLLHECGVLFVASAFDASRFEWHSVETLRALGEKPEVVDARDAATRWPQFVWDDMAVGVFNPRGGWLEAARAVRAVADAARASGATLTEHQAVAAVEPRASGAALVVDGQARSYDAVLVCAGAWLVRLLPQLASSARITRQQISHYRPADASAFDGARFPVWVYDIIDEGWYGFPRTEDGVVKVALHGRSEDVDPDVSREIAPAFLDASRAFVRERIPALDADGELTGRACLYANSARGDLLVDAAPGMDNVYVAGLGSGHGFKLGPVLGELVADLIERDEVPAPLRLSAHRDVEVW